MNSINSSQKPKKKYAFLDRDGTIIVDKIYLSDPEAIEFTPGAVQGMRLMLQAGFELIIITNQSAVARGIIDEKKLSMIHERLISMLRSENIEIAGIFYCPHHPQDCCDCRKPKPGMLINAIAEFKIDPLFSVFIGDADSDMGAAKAAGIRGIKVQADDGFNRSVSFLEAARQAISLLF